MTIMMIIMTKPHRHFQTMNKAPAKYDKDQTKIVGEVTLTKYQFIASEVPKNDEVHKLKT